VGVFFRLGAFLHWFSLGHVGGESGVTEGRHVVHNQVHVGVVDGWGIGASVRGQWSRLTAVLVDPRCSSRANRSL
jgi:hypothetical protein